MNQNSPLPVAALVLLALTGCYDPVYGKPGDSADTGADSGTESTETDTTTDDCVDPRPAHITIYEGMYTISTGYEYQYLTWAYPSEPAHEWSSDLYIVFNGWNSGGLTLDYDIEGYWYDIECDYDGDGINDSESCEDTALVSIAIFPDCG